MKVVEKQGLMPMLGRSLVVVVGLLAAAGSANQNRARATAPSAGTFSPEPAPASEPMDATMAIGLWKSNFGPVKIVQGDGDVVMGVWVYDRDGQEIVGYFDGSLDGNVLQLDWHEPHQPSALEGGGYLVFDISGRSFTGKWWTTSGDRSGAWNGWRTADTMPAGSVQEDGAVEGADAPADGPAEQASAPPDTEIL